MYSRDLPSRGSPLPTAAFPPHSGEDPKGQRDPSPWSRLLLLSYLLAFLWRVVVVPCGGELLCCSIILPQAPPSGSTLPSLFFLGLRQTLHLPSDRQRHHRGARK